MTQAQTPEALRLADEQETALLAVANGEMKPGKLPLELFVRGAAELRRLAAVEAELAALKEALRFYADGNHFTRFQPEAWDTVSGEPANYWEDESNTAQVEDGTVAKYALRDASPASQAAPSPTGPQEGTPYEDGAWYWVEFSSWGNKPPIIAPAAYRADCEAWYSYEFSGISTRFLNVLGPCAPAGVTAPQAAISDFDRVNSFVHFMLANCTNPELHADEERAIRTNVEILQQWRGGAHDDYVGELYGRQIRGVGGQEQGLGAGAGGGGVRAGFPGDVASVNAPRAEAADALDAAQIHREGLPKAGVYVLAWLEGRSLPIRAMWVPPKFLECGDDNPEESGEYDESKDQFFCHEGWYEANEHEETHWFVTRKVIAWAHLPRIDAAIAQAAGQGE